jgi:hypothetical protein
MCYRLLRLHLSAKAATQKRYISGWNCGTTLMEPEEGEKWPRQEDINRILSQSCFKGFVGPE